MTRVIMLLILGIFVALAPGWTGCQKKSPEAPAGNQKYTCSMHPEVVQDGPEKCPKCGMELVPKS